MKPTNGWDNPTSNEHHSLYSMSIGSPVEHDGSGADQFPLFPQMILPSPMYPQSQVTLMDVLTGT